MKSLPFLFVAVFSVSFASCNHAQKLSQIPGSSTQVAQSNSGDAPQLKEPGEVRLLKTQQQLSLKQAAESESATTAIDRKILQDATLTIEVHSALDAQSKVTSIAAARGGFVVTSESKRRESNDPSQRELDISLVVRVPAAHFISTLEELRAMGNRLLLEKVTGQDVTEEFIDLEARIKTEKALESQFLQIMKQAGKITDALEVQSQIANVRTQIERLEGRKRFLENSAALSTITVNLQSPTAIVNTSGFWRNLREGVADSVELASEIVLFLIRLAIIMIPIFILVILPGSLLVRYLFRRAKRLQLARELKTVPES